LCNAHLLRELTAVWENAKQDWAQKLIELLLKMKEVKAKFLSHELPDNIPLYLNYLKYFKVEYDKLLDEALSQNPVSMRAKGQKGKPKRGKTGALVDRLILRKDQYLLFFTDFNVPFDNNQAERDIRMFKVKQRVSGCFRTMQGAKDFAAITSYVSTARKRGIPGFQAIKNALSGNPLSVNSLATE
jgi:transposase